jgi:hypothetical protein
VRRLSAQREREQAERLCSRLIICFWRGIVPRGWGAHVGRVGAEGEIVEMVELRDRCEKKE